MENDVSPPPACPHRRRHPQPALRLCGRSGGVYPRQLHPDDGRPRTLTSRISRPAPAGPSADASEDAENSGAQQPVEFQYEGVRGPDAWPTLSPEWAACADTTAQSPIDLGAATRKSLPDLEFDYRRGEVSLKNTTHTVQGDETPGSVMVANGTRWRLAQFHLHEAAEHTVAGVRHDAELHLVHTSADGRIAVVSVLIDEGKASKPLGTYFASLPARGGATAELPAFNPVDLLPERHRAYRYTGSLTTPPCTEGVSWFVMDQPVQASAAQLEHFRSVIAENDRPLQKQGSREVLLDSDGA